MFVNPLHVILCQKLCLRNALEHQNTVFDLTSPHAPTSPWRFTLYGLSISIKPSGVISIFIRIQLVDELSVDHDQLTSDEAS